MSYTGSVSQKVLVSATDDATGKIFTKLKIVGGHQYRMPIDRKFLKQTHYRNAGLRIKVTGRFVCKNEARIIEQRPGYHDSLLFATR